MMPHGQPSKDSELPGPQSSTGDLTGMQVPQDEGATASASSESCSSSSVIGATPRAQPGPGMRSSPPNPQHTPFLPGAVVPPPRGLYSKSFSRQEGEGPSPSQAKGSLGIGQDGFITDKLNQLVPFLLHKYHEKEQVTIADMLQIVSLEYYEHIPLVFAELYQCLYVSFGIDMREVNPPGHIYTLAPVLGLTYSGLLDDNAQIIPKAELLIFILSVITANGNRVSEQDLRELLKNEHLLGQRERITIGDPWKFITEDLVREEYLVYQQVPNSDPARYEIFWGPRAHAETTQVKILQHVVSPNRTDPRSYPDFYEVALREEAGLFEAFESQDE